MTHQPGLPAALETLIEDAIRGDPGSPLRPKGQPEPVRVHDFKIPEPGKVAPYGVYDIAANHGWVSVGIDADTGAFWKRGQTDEDGA